MRWLPGSWRALVGQPFTSMYDGCPSCCRAMHFCRSCIIFKRSSTSKQVNFLSHFVGVLLGYWNWTFKKHYLDRCYVFQIHLSRKTHTTSWAFFLKIPPRSFINLRKIKRSKEKTGLQFCLFTFVALVHVRIWEPSRYLSDLLCEPSWVFTSGRLDGGHPYKSREVGQPFFLRICGVISSLPGRNSREDYWLWVAVQHWLTVGK